MKITFLGTNGWYDSPTGNTPCTLLETEKYYLVFDAGNGIYKLDKYTTKNKPVYLFISHFHIDHVSGLHILPKFNFKKGLKIFLEPGRIKDFNKLANIPYMAPIKKLHYKVAAKELNYGASKIPFKIECLKLRHMWGSVGFRIEIENKTIFYCLDTGYCENIIKLSRKADISITESAVKSGKMYDKWGHLDPVLAAGIASEAKVKRLILTHFGADQYRTHADKKILIEKARKIFKNIVVAKENQTLKI